MAFLCNAMDIQYAVFTFAILMKKTLISFIFLFLPVLAFSQRLFIAADGTTATDFRRIIGHRDKQGTRIFDQRFVKKNGTYYLQIRTYNRFGEDKMLKEGAILQIHMMYHKGVVDVKCNKVSTFDDKKYYADYPITEQQIDLIIQNKYVNVVVETTVDTIDVEGNNEFNYDLRSAASAILTGRDVEGRKVKPEERELPR